MTLTTVIFCILALLVGLLVGFSFGLLMVVWFMSRKGFTRYDFDRLFDD
jgi:hypothetical protein